MLGRKNSVDQSLLGQIHSKDKQIEDQKKRIDLLEKILKQTLDRVGLINVDNDDVGKKMIVYDHLEIARKVLYRD